MLGIYSESLLDPTGAYYFNKIVDYCSGAPVTFQQIDCTLCGCACYRPLFKKFGLQLAECAECGLVFVNPRLPEKETLGRYDETYFEQEYLPSLGVQDGVYDLDFFDRRYSFYLGLIADRAGPAAGGKLLEIGAGAGFFLKSAQRAGWEVSGTEVSKPCFDYATKELALNLRHEQAENLTFEAGEFDVVVLFDVLEHLFDPLKVMRAVNKVLKKGGVLFMGTPNYEALARKMLGRGWSIISPVDHLYYFTERTLEKLLARAGFQQIQFVKNHSELGIFETSNPRNTHQPHSLRARFYTVLVERFGARFARSVQARGWADNILCFAQSEARLPSKPVAAVDSPRTAPLES
jgi:2-polyprenyl-3-methyl-5-hydroxy-6-metoxy-1,4-benzoquinol methylase